MRNEAVSIDSVVRSPLRLNVTRALRQASFRMVAIALLRIAFGAIWAVDASLKWQPAFRANFSQILASVAHGQPAFLVKWFALWQLIVAGRAPIFSGLTALTETYLAIALMFGFARKVTYTIGIAYTFFVWSVAEGFGGPYVPGTTTDVGAAIIYSLVFAALLIADAGRISVDRLIIARVPVWRRIAG